MARRIICKCENLTEALDTLCRKTGRTWTETQYDGVEACGNALMNNIDRSPANTAGDITWHGIAEVPKLGWVYLQTHGCNPPDLKSLVRGRMRLEDAVMLGLEGQIGEL